MKRLAVLGASGHGKVVAEIAELNDWDVVFFDDAYSVLSHLEHWPVVGNTNDLLSVLQSFDGCFVAIGNNKIRLAKQRLLSEQGAVFPFLNHPSAIVSRYSKLGAGSVVMAGAVINPFVQIGRACIVNTSATIDHDCLLAAGVHISPGVNLAGAVEVGETSWIGIGASVKPCIEIGSNVIVGAGAVVVNNLPSDCLVTGVPAKLKEKLGV